MRIVFMGTPEFAVASLDALIKNNLDVVAVITAPDKPAGRGQNLAQSAVKIYALQKQIKILQPENLKDENFIKELKGLKADLQLVVAFRMLPESVWNMPPLGTYNLHASLLPKYRGAAPINWAIINGEKETGITTFKLKHEIDTGNILFSEKAQISEKMNAGELHDLLMQKGADLILKTVSEVQTNYEQGKQPIFIPQNEKEVCHAPKLNKETCRINWNRDSKSIYNLIRGLSPYPGAFTELITAVKQPLVLKIFNADYQMLNHTFSIGHIETDSKSVFRVYCSNGFVLIKELQLQGKKRMMTEEFLRGFKLTKEHFIT